MSERGSFYMFNSRHDMQREPIVERLDVSRLLGEKKNVKVSYAEKKKLEVSEKLQSKTKLAPKGTIFRAPVSAKK